MFEQSLKLKTPGLFVAGTDTEVGKTLVACAIAWQLRHQARGPMRVGVCKPIATGCRREREGLVSEDAEALAHFANSAEPLDIVNPVRYSPPVAPAVAAEQSGTPIDYQAIARSLMLLDEESDAIIVEGVGGIMTPIDEGAGDGGRTGVRTVLDLAAALPFPVVVVTRATLGTLNHTAMTVRLLRDAGCKVAGLVVNGYEPDAARETDPSIQTNRQWLERMNNVPVLATIPRAAAETIEPHTGRLDKAVLNAVSEVAWADVLGCGR